MTDHEEEMDDGSSGREARIHQLRSRRDAALHRGITIDIQGEPRRIRTTETALARIDQAALDAERRPDGWAKHWRAVGGWVEVDADDMERIRSAAADHVEAVFQRYGEIEAEILAADDPAGVDIGSGWP